LDIQYRLSPKNPFPAPLHDIEDVVKYIHSRPKEFDSSRLSISGFSAGANLSLSASSMILPKDTFRAVLAFYPPADLANHPSTKTAPDTSGKNIPPFIAGIFDASYFQSNDPQDPRISPFYAPAERFPRNILIVTPARDYLANEGEVLAKKIEKQGGKGRYVMHRRLEGVGHAWDKAVEKGSHEERMRDEAYAAAVDVLKR
jgi:acetyl esterase/lipase